MTDTAARMRKAVAPHIPAYLLLSLVMVFTFSRCLGHDFVYWDDVQYVVINKVVRGITLDHLRMAFTRSFVGNFAPLHMISYMLDYELWGMSAAGFIFTNLLLHLLNGILFYHLCVRLMARRTGATLAAFIFLFHPVQIESVVWISQRKNVLSLFFFLIAFLCFLSFRNGGRRARWLYAISLIAYALALLAKVAAVILPLAIILHDLTADDGKRLRQRVREYLPFILLSVVLAGVAIATQRLTQEGAPVGYYAGTGFKTFLTMIAVFPQYLLNIVWPQFLSIIYSPPIRSSFDPVVALSALLLVLLILEGAIIYLRHRRLFFWYALFFCAFLPVAQIIPLPTIMQDRYCYYPLLGFCGFVGAIAANYFSRSCRSTVGCVLGVIALSPVALLPVLSRWHAEIWKDPITLFAETARAGIGSRYGYYANFVEYNLTRICFTRGEQLLDAGKEDAALHCYLQALSVDPLHYESLVRVSILLIDRGKYAAARRYLDRIAENFPRGSEGFYGWGRYYAATGDRVRAEASYRRSLALDPSFSPAAQALKVFSPEGTRG